MIPILQVRHFLFQIMQFFLAFQHMFGGERAERDQQDGGGDAAQYEGHPQAGRQRDPVRIP